MIAHELRTLPLGAKPQVLHLQQADHRVVIVGLQEIHLPVPDAGASKQPIAIQNPPAAHLDGILRKSIVPFTARQDFYEIQVKIPRASPGHDEKGLGPRTGHDAVEQPKRLGYLPRIEILLQREGLTEQRIRKAESVLTLSHAKFAKILSARPKFPHVVSGQESEAGVRTACPVWPHCVLRKLAEITEG